MHLSINEVSTDSATFVIYIPTINFTLTPIVCISRLKIWFVFIHRNQCGSSPPNQGLVKSTLWYWRNCLHAFVCASMYQSILFPPCHPHPTPSRRGYGPYGHVRRLVLTATRTFTDRNVERDSSDTDSTSEDSEESCCACVPVSHGEHRGTHEGKPKKVGKSGWNVDVREKACYEMNCYLIDVIYFLYVRKM